MNCKRILCTAFALLLIISALAGCGKTENHDKTADDVKPVEDTSSAESQVPEAETGMKDGERFESTIILEGSEEKVGYEHAISKSFGFELDFEYNSLTRVSENDRERFTSSYESGDDAWNYLEVKSRTESADSVADELVAALSNDFDSVEKKNITLDKAGECVVIDAFGAKDGSIRMQTVYVFPAADGCRVAEAHYTIESAEGFGTRFAYMMNTFSPIAK